MDLPARQQPNALQAKAQLQAMSAAAVEPIAVGLNAAVFAVQGDEPVVAVVPARREERSDGALPSGLFSPRQHDSLETALRFWVRHQTGIELASARQICTLGGCQGPAGEAQPQGFRSSPSAIWRSSLPTASTTATASAGAAGMPISPGRTGAAANRRA